MEYEDRSAMHSSRVLWQMGQLRLGPQASYVSHTTPLPPPPGPGPQDSQEEEDPCVSHGIGQSQDAAAHDGIAEIEHGHSKRCLPLELPVRAGRAHMGRETR